MTKLFPDRASTLARTDPELIERFDNFAFDEVIADSDLDIRTRLMVQLASLIACQAVSEFRVMAGAGLTVGLTPVELKEIVYQAVPYVGMAKVFDFLHAANDVLTECGVQLPLPGQSTTTPATRLERGLAVQKQIVGGERVDAMYDAAPDDEQHLQRYLSGNCGHETPERKSTLHARSSASASSPGAPSAKAFSPAKSALRPASKAPTYVAGSLASAPRHVEPTSPSSDSSARSPNATTQLPPRSRWPGSSPRSRGSCLSPAHASQSEWRRTWPRPAST